MGILRSASYVAKEYGAKAGLKAAYRMTALPHIATKVAAHVASNADNYIFGGTIAGVIASPHFARPISTMSARVARKLHGKKDIKFYGHSQVSGYGKDPFYSNVSNPIGKGKC